MSKKSTHCSIEADDDGEISFDDEDATLVYDIPESEGKRSKLGNMRALTKSACDFCLIPDAEPIKFPCDICDSCFDTKEDRNIHIEDHFKRYECPNCTRSFVGDRAYEYHTRSGKCKTVVEQTLFRCNLCNEKVFKSAAALKVHENSVHRCAIETNRITCKQCQRTFAQLRYLRKHIYEVHRKLTQFSCSVCHKVFNRRSNLSEHMLIHEQKYLAPCSICKKSYRTKSALRLHERMHTGEKPYKCDICSEKAYAYNTDLKRHKRQVHGILGTQHPCRVCHRIFYEPKLLRNHCKKYHRSDTAPVIVEE